MCHLRPRLGELAARDQERDHPHRHVDEEDPAPAEEVGEDAAQQRTRGRTGRGHRAPGAESPGPGRAFGIRRRQDGEGGGCQDGRTQPLEGAGADQQGLVLGQAAEQTREGEHRQADEEDLAPPVEVGRPAAEQQETGEGQGVRIDDPLQVRIAEVQVVLYRRQRDVHDGRVEHDHELPHAHDGEDEPGRYGPARLECDEVVFPGVVVRHASSPCAPVFGSVGPQPTDNAARRPAIPTLWLRLEDRWRGSDVVLC